MDATDDVLTPHPEAPDAWAPSELADLLQRVLILAADVRSAMAQRMSLNPTDVSAMEHLMGEPIGPVELSRRLGISSASGTVLVDRLEEAGHVRRTPDPQDGRRCRVVPTEQGARSVFAEVAPLVTDLLAAEEGLDAHDRTAVAGYLSRVAEALRGHGRDA
ncbi:MAG: MarR family transcriptional regulator [Actinomycetes bacterium]